MVSNYGDRAREWRTSSIPIVPETGRAPRWVPDSTAPDCPPSDWQRGGVDDASDRADAGLATGLLRRRNDVADRRPSSGLGCRVDDIRAWIDAHPIEACLGQGSAHDPGGAWRADTDASSTDEAGSASSRRGAVIDWEVAETQVRGIHLCLAVTPEVILDALAVNANVIVSRRAVFAAVACCGTQNAMMANAKWAAILSRHSLSCV
ncbi:MAG: hypothetical protein EB145_08640, partial [Proteobacteria bacterium]|nr:hypothetical protein [Pseudomonadota bacterium]